MEVVLSSITEYGERYEKYKYKDKHKYKYKYNKFTEREDGGGAEQCDRVWGAI